MSDKVTVYEAATGKIRRVLLLPLVGMLDEDGEIVGHIINPVDLANNVAGDERYVLGEFGSDRFYWDGSAMAAFPDPPSEWAEFDFAARQWVDHYDPALALAAARASANMTRSDFLLAAISAGIILPSDAGPAARGEIPPSLVPVFDGLPLEVRIEAVVRWGAATVIERTNPVLAALAEAMAITDADLDALFGIS
ncbi:hypothetical protein [Paracoccus sulfuroxidans]|uniref:DUF4376 domain-containing protein n=1 Tax=Paracoccus sulfuroxidans TaxID=384678 RepID=A0A562NQ14_9RHOB|nr:hypothetical protein [Paracoccus sulfuroxidans]AZV00350.1 hypothetical protein psul1_p42 [Paracoccus phage vB_PsuS_Psul1]TWI34297.1 hypothetical protein IQ24_01812 [Paracoccus sulfuroxidans]